MSNSRQSSEPDVRGYAVTHPPGRIQLPQQAGWDQFIYAERGVMSVATSDSRWTIPPHRALWVPNGQRTIVSNGSATALRSLYFGADLAVLPGAIRALNVSSLVRELVLHAVRSAPLLLNDPIDHALVTVLTDQLRRLPDEPLRLPWPTDPRAAEAARTLADRPMTSVGAAVNSIHASRRTLERAFVEETGLSLGAWRRRAVILGSLEMLTSGLTVTETAARSGYSTPSAFVAAFRLELGTTPRRFIGH